VAGVLDLLVANITKGHFTFLATKHVVRALFVVDPLAAWAFDTELEVDPLHIASTSVLLDNVLGHLSRQDRPLIRVMVWVLLVVLLPFSRRIAAPAEIVKAFCALNLSATALNHRDRNSTF
jgi:hypothetical protein